MKKKATVNKLNLSKETILVLSSDSLNNVKGGAKCPGISSKDPSDPDFIDDTLYSEMNSSGLY